MNREILFRGKSLVFDIWVKGDLLNYSPNPKICVTRNEEEDKDLYFVLKETVGQYTGLSDKNGKKIFEGDIVNCVYDGILRTYIVVWDKDELDFKATNGEEQYRNNFMYLPCCDEIEIIGNIHESYWKAVRKNENR